MSDVKNEDVEPHIFDELKDVSIKHPNKCQCAYLNINSFRNKFQSIKELLNENIVDMIIVGEIKLDETFRNGEFPVDNFHLWRADRTANGGGLLVYIRSDLACMRKNKLECEHIESIFTEISFKDKKWLICGLYRPPSLCDNIFIEDFIKTFDNISTKYDNIIIIGDLNYNYLHDEKCTPL
jgi:exonuclease III